MSTVLDFLILYHGNCTDGFTSAIIAKHALSTTNQKVDYIPIKVEKLTETIPTLPPAHKVLSFDLAYTQTDVNLLLNKYPTAEIYDHHISTSREIPKLTDDQKRSVTFDNNRSGAMLAWDYFYSNHPAPLFVQYVQDRDLWTWKLPDSEIINTWIYQETGLSFNNSLDLWFKYLESDDWTESAKIKGKEILQKRDDEINFLMTESRLLFGKLDGSVVVFCESLGSVYVSEIGNKLCKKYNVDYSAIWTVNKDSADKSVKISMRSVDGKADVSLICRKYGGGGHAKAAGCTVSIERFLEMLVEIEQNRIHPNVL